MKEIKKEIEFIDLFQRIGLNYNDSLVFFTLIKLGSKGSTVLELQHTLDIKRTTIYSILKKLIELGYVKEESKLYGAKKATIFFAINPNDYFNRLLLKKRKELERIQKIKQKYSNQLTLIYRRGIEYSYEDLDTLIQPYLKSLTEKGYKIIRNIIKEEAFGFKLYEIAFYSPKSKYIKENGINILVFDFNIEKDKNTLKFIIHGLKKESKKIYSIIIGNIQFSDDELEFYGKRYTTFNMSIKQEDLKKSNYFSKTSENHDKKVINNSNDLINIQKFVILPIKDKIFYLWAESYEVLNEMIKSILN